MKFFEVNFPLLYGVVHPHRAVVKYLISGCTAAFVNIGGLYFLTEVFAIYYLYSAIVSFFVAFWVSFGLQKFWTFKDPSKHILIRQVVFYFVVSVFGLSANTLILYLLVEYLQVWYVFAQIITGATLACFNFFVYKYLIFKVHQLI